MARKRLGEILTEAGLIDEAGLRAALVEQRRHGGPLGRILVDLKLVGEDDLVRALSRQLAIPTVDLDQLDIPQAVLDLVPGEWAEAHGLVPFAQPMKFLDVAMTDPTNLGLIDEIRVKTQLNVRTYIAGPKAMERAVAHFYGRGLPRQPVGRRVRESHAPATVDLDPDAGEMQLTRPASISSPPPLSVIGPPIIAASSPAITPPPVLGRTPTPHGPTYADVAALQERIASLEALVRRDEEVLRQLMGLLIEKGVATREEIVERLK